MKHLDKSLSQKFEQQGFVIIDAGLDEKVLDGACDDLSGYFGENREHPIHVPHADHNRIQDAWYISQNVLAIAQSQTVLDTLNELYETTARPFQTLNFYTGTQQAVHADNIHFNSEPFGYMCGVWVALEDIGADQGPLVYYPGSQKLPEMNYDSFGLKSSYESYPRYLAELQKIITEKGYQPELGIIKKGQAVIWSANILHGGSVQNDRSLTRKSQVTHYYMEGAEYWRPNLSDSERAYFSPDWVRDVSGEEPKFPIVVPQLTFTQRLRGAIARRIFRR